MVPRRWFFRIFVVGTSICGLTLLALYWKEIYFLAWLLWPEPPPPRIESDLEIHAIQAWEAPYAFPIGVPVTPSNTKRPHLDIVTDAYSGMYFLRNRPTIEYPTSPQPLEYAPGTYAFHPDTGRLFKVEDPMALARVAPAFDRASRSDGWDPTRKLLCDRHENVVRAPDREPIPFAGEHCAWATVALDPRYAVVVSADGPSRGLGLVGFSSPIYVGQMYMQTYDWENDVSVGEPVKLPFRWGGIPGAVFMPYESCPTPDGRFVVFFNSGLAAKLVFVPTGLPRLPA